MGGRKEALTRFEAIAKGRYVPKKLSVREAKERLRRVDPGIDFSRVFQALDAGDVKRAGTSLAVEVAASQALTYFYPLVVDTVQLVSDLISKKTKRD